MKKIFIFLLIITLSILSVNATILNHQDGQERLTDMTSHLTDNLGGCNQNFKVHTQLTSIVVNKANQITSGISSKYNKAEALFNYVRDIPYPSEDDKMCLGDVCGYRWNYPEEIINQKCTDEDTIPQLKDKCKTADCKSKSNLLLSLLRVSGFTAEEAFVVSSYSEGHQYLILKMPDEEWMVVDPTWLTSFYATQGHGDVLEPSALGNDKYLYDDTCKGNINVNQPPQDPCDGVSCPTKCEGDYALTNGNCINGECAYTRNYCNKGCEGGSCKVIGEWEDPCGFSSDCGEGLICGWDGRCKKTVGQSCSSDSECYTDFCNRNVCEWGSIHCYPDGHYCSLDTDCCNEECQRGYVEFLREEQYCHTGDWCDNTNDCSYCSINPISGVPTGYVAECKKLYGRDYKTCDYLYATTNYCNGCIDSLNYYSGCKDGNCLTETCPTNTECENGVCVPIYQPPTPPPPPPPNGGDNILMIGGIALSIVGIIFLIIGLII